MKRINQDVPQAAYSVPQVMQALGLSRQTVYDEINNGRLRSFKLGRRRLISAEALRNWVASLESSQAA